MPDSGQTASGNLDATYSYDNEGKVTSVIYPNGGDTYQDSYDAMRLVKMTDVTLSPWVDLVTSVTCGPAGELTHIIHGATNSSLYGETRSYNNRLQLTRLTDRPTNSSANSVDME